MSEEKARGGLLVYVSLIMIVVSLCLLISAAIVYKIRNDYQRRLDDKQSQILALSENNRELSAYRDATRKTRAALDLYPVAAKKMELELANARNMVEQLQRSKMEQTNAQQDLQKSLTEEWKKKFADREQEFASEKNKILADINLKALRPQLPGMKKMNGWIDVKVEEKFFRMFTLNLEKNVAICTLSAADGNLHPVFSLLILSEHGIPIARAVADGSLEIKKGEIRVVEIPLERYVFDEFPEVSPVYYTLKFEIKPKQVVVGPPAAADLSREIAKLAGALLEDNRKASLLCQRYKNPGMLKSQFEKEYAGFGPSAAKTLDALGKLVNANTSVKLEGMYKAGQELERFSREAHNLINDWIAMKAKDPFPAVEVFRKAAKAYEKLAVEIDSTTERKGEK